MNIGIVGGGIFGLAAAVELRGRGHLLTVFEQGTVPFEKATSTDVSKAIRRTWYAGDNETYVELVERAASRWREWEKMFGFPIYHQVGGINIVEAFEPGTPMFESVKFLQERGAEIAVLSARQAKSRFPQFAIKSEETCVHDPWAGYLESGQAVRCLARLARSEGVKIVENMMVTQVEDVPGGVQVSTNSSRTGFDRLVVAAGAWMGRLLSEIDRYLEVTHQEMVLIDVEDPRPFGRDSMPVWGVHTLGEIEELWYGFPLLREGYVKVSHEPRGQIVDPDVDRRGSPEFAERAMQFLAERIPDMAKGTIVESRACLYANTPDDHFIIDWAPGSRRILVAGGGSGHGFKFGGVIGEVIADALDEKENSLGRRFRIGDRFDLDRHKQVQLKTRGFAIPPRGV